MIRTEQFRIHTLFRISGKLEVGKSFFSQLIDVEKPSLFLSLYALSIPQLLGNKLLQDPGYLSTFPCVVQLKKIIEKRIKRLE